MRRTRSVAGVAAVVIGLLGAVVAGAPAGADVIELDPIYETVFDGMPQWSVAALSDGGYAIGYSIFVNRNWVAWGPDIGTVLWTDLSYPADAAGGPDYTDVDDRGVAVGTYRVSGAWTERPFVEDLHDKVVTPLDRGPHQGAVMGRIGSDGTIVGSLFSGPAPTYDAMHGAAWVGPDHHLVLVPDLGHGSMLDDVDASGVATGWMADETGARHPTTWAVGSDPVERIDLTPITGLMTGAGDQVTTNDVGDVLVELGYDDGVVAFDTGHEVVVEHGTHRLIEPYEVGTGYGSILNDAGQVAYRSGPFPIPSPIPAGGGDFEIVDLASGARTPVPGFGHSVFFFNDRGQISTTDAPAGALPVAMLWDPVRGWLDLGDAGGRGTFATALNNVGNLGGYFGNDASAPWIATVQFGPEPPRDPDVRVTGGEVALRWEPPVSPGNAPVSSYHVYRDGVLVGAVSPSSTTFTEAVPVAPGASVTYAVTAVNEYGESESSPLAAATVPLEITDPTTTTTSVPVTDPVPAGPTTTAPSAVPVAALPMAAAAPAAAVPASPAFTG